MRVTKNIVFYNQNAKEICSIQYSESNLKWAKVQQEIFGGFLCLEISYTLNNK